MTEKHHFTYTIPTTPEEIPLHKWITFEALATTPDIDPQFLESKMIEIFCSIPSQHIKQLKQIEIDEILGHLNAVLTSETTLHTTFTFGGLKYGLIPSFDKDITAGELIDMDGYLDKKDFISLMSILYRPVTIDQQDMYQIEPYFGTHQLFKDLPYHYFTGCLAFFLDLYPALAVASLQYISKTAKKLDATLVSKLNSLLSTMDMST